MSSLTGPSARLTRIRRTGIGFAVGSALFAVGVPLSLSTSLSPAVAGWTFFAGSVFFTGAAFLQLVSSREELPPVPGDERVWLRLWRPRTSDWTASAVQFVGTLEFNVTTLLAALDAAGKASASASAVWRPDAVGSVLFLVSSAIAFVPEVRARRHGHARDRSWAIGALNLLGSIFFGISAVGAYTQPASGDLVSLRWDDAGTFLGAVCFLVGAILLVPRRGEQAAAPVQGGG